MSKFVRTEDTIQYLRGKTIVSIADEGDWTIVFLDDGIQWHIPTMESAGYVIAHPRVN